MTTIAGAPRRIELDDVTALGNVDDALGDFYVEQIAAAATTSGVPPRVIREWFEDQLISAQGFRTQVLDGPGDNGPVVLRELEDAHLIRADSRRGAQWYEISHDRLVAPILASNAAWRDRHLSALQVDARAWDRADRSAGLLVGGEVLATAEAWASANPDELLPVDRDYLDACRAAEVQIVAIERAARRNRVLAIAASALLVLAVIGLLVAMIYWRSASESADEARIARDDAEQALQAAEDAEAAALREAQRAEEEAQRAEQEAERAEEEAQRASAEETEAKNQKTRADEARDIAEQAQADLKVAVVDATSAEESARSAEEVARKAEAVATAEAANANRSAAAARASDERAQRDRDAALEAEDATATARRTADSERLGLIASGLITGDVELAGLLAIEANKAAFTEISQRALLDAARAIAIQERCVNDGSIVAVSPLGPFALTLPYTEYPDLGRDFFRLTISTPIPGQCGLPGPAPGRWDRIFETRVGASLSESVVFSPNGEQLAVAAVEGIHVLDADDGDPIMMLSGESAPLSISADGRWLATSSSFYDVTAADPLATRVQNPFSSEVKFAGIGKPIAGLVNGELQIAVFPDVGLLTPVEDFDPLMNDAHGFDFVTAFDVSSTGLLARATSRSTGISIVDTTARLRTCLLEGHLGHVTFLAFTPNGSTLLSVSNGSTVRSWSVAGDEQRGVPPCSLTGTITPCPPGRPERCSGADASRLDLVGSQIVTSAGNIHSMWIPALFDASPKELTDFIVDNLGGRTLTDEERARYRIE